MHRFDFDEDPLTSAYYLPGGEFLVFLHASGSISLKRIDGLAEVDEWELSEVARYEPRNAEGRPAFSSETLNEISYGRFALAYTVEGNSDRCAHHRSYSHRPSPCSLGSSFFTSITSCKSSRRDRLYKSTNPTSTISTMRFWCPIASGWRRARSSTFARTRTRTTNIRISL